MQNKHENLFSTIETETERIFILKTKISLIWNWIKNSYPFWQCKVHISGVFNGSVCVSFVLKDIHKLIQQEAKLSLG